MVAFVRIITALGVRIKRGYRYRYFLKGLDSHTSTIVVLCAGENLSRIGELIVNPPKKAAALREVFDDAAYEADALNDVGDDEEEDNDDEDDAGDEDAGGDEEEEVMSLLSSSVEAMSFDSPHASSDGAGGNGGGGGGGGAPQPVYQRAMASVRSPQPTAGPEDTKFSKTS